MAEPQRFAASLKMHLFDNLEMICKYFHAYAGRVGRLQANISSFKS